MGKDYKRGKYTSPEGSHTWEYLTAIFCSSGMFCMGTVIGWNSPSLDELNGPNSPIPIMPEDASTLTACVSVGYGCALILNIFIVDRLGRKNSVLFATVPLMINWGLILVTEHVLILIVARIMGGFSFGITVYGSTIYIIESLPANIRGSLGAISSVTFYIGVLFMFGVGPYLGLRITAAFCMGFTMIFMICFWFIPESPYFLVMVGKVDEAESALEKLRGKTDVADELELIKATLREKGKSLLESDEIRKEFGPRKQSVLRKLFTIRGNLKSLLLGMILIMLQHFCGFEMVLYYCHIILKDMGSQLDLYLASLIFSILQIFSAALTTLTIDKFGRRPLLLTSGTITSFLLAIIAAYFYLIEHTDIDVKQYSTIPLCSIFLLVVVLNMGVMSVPDTIQAEMYAIDVKMLTNCIAGLSGSIMTMITAKSYLLMAKSWGFGHSIPFFIFAIGTFICTSLLMRWLPETKGKTLLEIQRELNA